MLVKGALSSYHIDARWVNHFYQSVVQALTENIKVPIIMDDKYNDMFLIEFFLKKYKHLDSFISVLTNRDSPSGGLTYLSCM